MNLSKKNYNPCGDLTGRERAICDAALTKYFDLPFVQVMRNIVLEEISNATHTYDAQKISDWASQNLNDIERQACIDFDSAEFNSMSPAQIGLFKYFVHLLFENRYNIFYNRLVNFCAEENFNVTDNLEKILDRTAQVGDYFTSFNTLAENFQYNLSHGGI